MIYISPLQTVKGRSGFWFILVSDESLAELHSFAEIIEAKPEQFVASQRLPRYELQLSYRAACLGAGADELGARAIRERCINAFELPLVDAQPPPKPPQTAPKSKPKRDTPNTPSASPEPAQQASAPPKRKPGRPKKVQ